MGFCFFGHLPQNAPRFLFICRSSFHQPTHPNDTGPAAAVHGSEMPLPLGLFQFKLIVHERGGGGGLNFVAFVIMFLLFTKNNV